MMFDTQTGIRYTLGAFTTTNMPESTVHRDLIPPASEEGTHRQVLVPDPPIVVTTSYAESKCNTTQQAEVREFVMRPDNIKQCAVFWVLLQVATELAAGRIDPENPDWTKIRLISSEDEASVRAILNKAATLLLHRSNWNNPCRHLAPTKTMQLYGITREQADALLHRTAYQNGDFSATSASVSSVAHHYLATMTARIASYLAGYDRDAWKGAIICPRAHIISLKYQTTLYEIMGHALNPRNCPPSETFARTGDITYTYMDIYIYIFMYIHIHTYIYIYIYIYFF